MDNKIKITCSLITMRFYKNEFGIAVVSVDSVQDGEPKTDKFNQITIKGVMPQLKEGNSYSLFAEYVSDPKWGGQYNVISIYEDIQLKDGDKIGEKRFIDSLFTELQVHAMYKALDDPFKALKDGNIDELVKVKGCGEITAKRWVKKFQKNIYLAEIFSELSAFNLTNGIVNRLIEAYGSPAVVIEKVKKNPYMLCNEVDGIGFKTADQIALKGGIDPNSIERIGAYIYKYLNDMGAVGYSWIDMSLLINEVKSFFGDNTPDSKILKAIELTSDNIWQNEEKTQIGLRKYFNIENRIAEELLRLQNSKSVIKYDEWESKVAQIEKKNGWEFTDEQKLGVKTVLENNVSVVYGEAGTGKSTSVSAFLEVLGHCTFVQCALSGRASARMAEITGKEGYTIHRLLGYPCHEPGNKEGFTFHDHNPLDVDIVIVDEVSMIDAFLFYYLIRAIPSGSNLVCLGDIGQLEAIGCGNVMFDMINSGVIPTVHLTKIHRQAALSAIITESRQIRSGNQITPKGWTGVETRGQLQDLVLDCYSEKNKTFAKILSIFKEEIKREDFDIMETQVLVPLKNIGEACTYTLNNALQALCNPPNKGKKQIEIHGQKPFVIRQGDKVINIKNNYRTDPPIFNGNIGIVKELYPEDKMIVIDFVGIGKVLVEGSQINNIHLGYAITVHKSQGSQFDRVIFGVDMSSYNMLTRELLYTGITRAKKMCYLVSQSTALQTAINKEGVSKKQTHLQNCLKQSKMKFFSLDLK